MANIPVLLVEDDPLVNLSSTEILQDAGYQVFAAYRGEDALRILDQHPEIELLVSDLGLPGVDGHQLATEARRRRSKIKILIVTGYDKTGASSIPGARYLGKPYASEELLGALHDLQVGAV